MDLAVNVAYTMLALAVAVTLTRLVRGPSLADRMVALDTLLFLLAGALGVAIVQTRSTWGVPIVVVVALVAFVGTVIVARYIAARGAR